MTRSLRSATLFSAILLCLLSVSDASARESVTFSAQTKPGTIVVRTSERRLYFVTARGHAIRYPVGVGRSGKQWFGATRIVGKYVRPGWTPPAEIRRGGAAYVIPGGSARNPMGAAALVLADNELAIHGTNNPASIGGFVSWGCIRMQNQDILDLFDRVNVGTTVYFTR